ncbi:Uncharacterised protein [uncultured archaeon]|nr:Uncharacterised protein [uncultured archaeon]
MKKTSKPVISNFFAILALVVLLGIIAITIIELFFSPESSSQSLQLTPQQQAQMSTILKNEDISGFNLSFVRTYNRQFNGETHLLAYVEFKDHFEGKSYLIDLNSNEILISSLTYYYANDTRTSEFRQVLRG